MPLLSRDGSTGQSLILAGFLPAQTASQVDHSCRNEEFQEPGRESS